MSAHRIFLYVITAIHSNILVMPPHIVTIPLCIVVINFSRTITILPQITCFLDADEVLSAASVQVEVYKPLSTQVPPTTLQSVSPPTLIHSFTTQSSLPPVPLRIRDQIIQGEFMKFCSLLSKAMLIGSSEPETNRSLTVQLAITSDPPNS